MTMTMVPVWLQVDRERTVATLQETLEKLNGAGDLFLDFSAVRWIDPNGLAVLEEMAEAADQKAVKVVLRGVNVDIYRVLKLVRLASRFSFLT